MYFFLIKEENRTWELLWIKISGTNGEKYEPCAMVDDYVDWNKYLLQTDHHVPINKHWAAWVTEKDLCDDHEMFLENKLVGLFV